VFVVIDEHPGARRVCSREWIYTAISRSKLACFLVGRKSTADSMCYRRALTRRKTFLAESLRQEIAKLNPAETVTT
jgi:ATP-dependent exoDNAse (exonuclease V) alpha subunit